jgi:hypothetical protein
MKASCLDRFIPEEIISSIYWTGSWVDPTAGLALNLYSGRTRFESWSFYQLSWRFSYFPSVNRPQPPPCRCNSFVEEACLWIELYLHCMPSKNDTFKTTHFSSQGYRRARGPRSGVPFLAYLTYCWAPIKANACSQATSLGSSTTDGVKVAIEIRTASVLPAYTSRYYNRGLYSSHWQVPESNLRVKLPSWQAFFT